jgi:hypothetical protein
MFKRNEFNLNKSTGLSWSYFLVPFFQNGPIVVFNSSSQKLKIMFRKQQVTTFQIHPCNHEVILNTRQSSVPTTLIHPLEEDAYSPVVLLCQHVSKFKWKWHKIYITLCVIALLLPESSSSSDACFWCINPSLEGRFRLIFPFLSFALL